MSATPTSPNELPHVLVTLMKGILERESAPVLWQGLVAHQARVRDHVGVIGLDLVLDEAEGHAYLRQRPQVEGEPELPRLVTRRQLGFSLSLMLALLRKKLARARRHERRDATCGHRGRHPRHGASVPARHGQRGAPQGARGPRHQQGGGAGLPASAQGPRRHLRGAAHPALLRRRAMARTARTSVSPSMRGTQARRWRDEAGAAHD